MADTQSPRPGEPVEPREPENTASDAGTEYEYSENEAEAEAENQAEAENENEEEEEESEEAQLAGLKKMMEELQGKDSSEAKPKIVRKRFERKKKVALKAEILDDPEIVRFFQGREKDPYGYSFTPEGNFKVEGVKDVPNKTIPITEKFVDFTSQADYVDLYKTRLDALKVEEAKFDLALQVLRETEEGYKRGDRTAEEVVRANVAVLEISRARSRIAYPEIWIDMIKKAAVQDVLMHTEPYEKRKMKYPIFLEKHHDLPRKTAWGKYVPRTTAVPLEGGALRIRFITDLQDETTAQFHPFFQRDFIFNETEYCCVYQAYEAERFKELGKDDLRKQVLGTRSGRTIHSIAIKDKAPPNQPQQLWEDILFQFYFQNPDLRKKLDATGTDKFHVMDREVPADYGTSLEEARFRLRELGEKDLDHQDVKEKAITEEDQKKAKVGAIIHKFRKH